MHVFKLLIRFQNILKSSCKTELIILEENKAQTKGKADIDLEAIINHV